MTLIKQIRESVMADSYGRKRDGTIIVRKEFFYSHGKTADDFAERVQRNLEAASIAARVVNSGEHWAAFNGGASVANSSHWWAIIEAK